MCAMERSGRHARGGEHERRGEREHEAERGTQPRLQTRAIGTGYPGIGGLHTPPPSICALVRYVFKNFHDGFSNCGIVPSSRTLVM